MQKDTILKISPGFVEHWAGKYDKRRVFARIHEEGEIRRWLATRGEPKYLNKRTFLMICWWKTGQMPHIVRSNHFTLIHRATRLVSEVENNDRLKLRILRLLRGVDIPIASTILHFLQPLLFPHFDRHVRSSLEKAARWNRSEDDESEDAWLEYVAIMRNLSRELGVGLHQLDKALWTYDKLGYTQDEDS